jgi:hypothetical protein
MRAHLLELVRLLGGAGGACSGAVRQAGCVVELKLQ